MELRIANVVRETLEIQLRSPITLNYFNAWRYLKLVTLTTSFYQRAVPARATFA